MLPCIGRGTRDDVKTSWLELQLGGSRVERRSGGLPRPSEESGIAMIQSGVVSECRRGGGPKGANPGGVGALPTIFLWSGRWRWQ